MVDQGLQLYLKEVVFHLDEYVIELNELSQVDILNSRDYRATERLLQLLTEVSIGLAKHWLKSIKKESGSNAYQIFVALQDIGAISDIELVEWRKIIGLRNSLVHDYLNVDKSIIKTIVKNEKYQTLVSFCEQAVDALQRDTGVS